MKAYKLKEAVNGIAAGRMFCGVGTEILLIATPTLPHSFTSSFTFQRLKERGVLEETDLMNEVKSHPHLYKPLKEAVYKLKNNKI